MPKQQPRLKLKRGGGVKSGRSGALKPDKLGLSCKAHNCSDAGTGDLGVLTTHETSPWFPLVMPPQNTRRDFPIGAPTRCFDLLSRQLLQPVAPQVLISSRDTYIGYQRPHGSEPHVARTGQPQWLCQGWVTARRFWCEDKNVNIISLLSLLALCLNNLG